MYLSVNGKIEKMNPLPIEVWEAIDSAEKYNSTISLHKKDNEYLEAILSYSGGYQLKYNNEEGSFKTHLKCIDEEDVKNIFNSYYFDKLDWKNHFRWEGKTLFNQIKSLFLGILALAFFIFYAANGFNRDITIDKIFYFFDSYGVSSYLILLLVFIVLIYSDLDYIRNYNKIEGYDKFRVTVLLILAVFMVFIFIVK